MLAGRPAHAQRADVATLDVGGVAIRQSDIIAGDAFTASALWHRARERWTLSATGAASWTDDSRYTALGIAAASVLTKPGRLRWELNGSAGVLGTTGVEATESWTLGLRQHWQFPMHGGWMGLTRGGYAGEWTTENLWSGEFAWWWREAVRQWTLGVNATSTRRHQFWFDDFNEIPQFYWDPLRFADASLGMRWIHGRADIDAQAGARLGLKGPADNTAFGSIGVTWWLTPRVAVATSIGRALDDPLRGTAESRYAMAAMRFSWHRARVIPRRGAPSGPVLDWRRDDGGMLLLMVRADSATSVELMGDFTDWQPVTLAAAAGSARWSTRMKVAPGARQLMIRINGGEWRPPANVTTTDDGFGGRVGMIVVP